MLRRWTIFSILALLAVLASGMNGVRLEKFGHACDGMSAGVNMEDCHRRQVGDGAAMADCATFICSSGQTALPAPEVAPRTLSIATLATQNAPRDDAQLRDLRGPPDLRPPIA